METDPWDADPPKLRSLSNFGHDLDFVIFDTRNHSYYLTASEAAKAGLS